jgi:putative (di)nucleoside polyphosphate hydrolase
MSQSKPYRRNVGIALFNADGRVLIGRRFRDDGPEIVLPGLEWQMPQGGIDADESPRDAVMRELWEETGVVDAAYLDETDWLTYEFPALPRPADASSGPVSRPASEVVCIAFRGTRRRH